MSSLSNIANRTFNPEHLASVEMKTGVKAPLGKVLNMALEYVDLVHLGDSDHRSTELVETGAAQKGIDHLFLEIDDYNQPYLEHYYANPTYREKFVEHAENWNNHVPEGFGELITNAIDTAQGNEAEVHFVNPGNGVEEFFAWENAYEEMKSGFFASRQEKESVSNALRAYKEARTVNDSQVAQRIDKAMDTGEKAVLIYGDGHGVWDVKTDLNGAMETSNIKISMYSSRDSYKEALDTHASILKDAPELKKYGMDRPELIYIKDENKVFFTEETPESLRKAIDEYTQTSDLNNFQGFTNKNGYNVIQ